MDTNQIERYLAKLPIRSGGVYASDSLPLTHISPSTAIVANTVPHTEGGEHWVVFYLDKAGLRLEYFDSYGRPPHVSEYLQFLRRNSHLPYTYNNRRLQGFETSVCAHYCLSYLYCRTIGSMTMGDFVQLFDVGSTAANDVLVKAFFRKVFT